MNHQCAPFNTLMQLAGAAMLLCRAMRLVVRNSHNRHALRLAVAPPTLSEIGQMPESRLAGFAQNVA